VTSRLRQVCPFLVPGYGLLDNEVRTGQEKGRDKIVPVGLTGEVGHLELVPRCLPGGPAERRRGIAALAGRYALDGLDGLPVRFPGGVLAGLRERGYYQPLVAGLAVQHDAVEQARLSLQGPDRAGDRGCDAESGDLLPAPHAAVPLDG
jgi:hypothetical protein